MSRTFVPAAGRNFLLPLYDPLWRLLGGSEFRASFIRDVRVAAGQRILDIGCGTGSLAVQIAQTVPGTRVHALDPDPKALARGLDKAGRAGVDIVWREGFGDSMPFEESSFDVVVSSFMFHHLSHDVKREMLREANRVLKSGGQLHLVDFGGHQRGHDGILARLLHSEAQIADNLNGGIPLLFEKAGFKNVREVSCKRMIFGRYAHISGVAA